MSLDFKKQYGNITIKIPSNLKNKTIKEIRIIPKYNARFFEIQYVYEITVEQRNLKYNKALAIDLGVNNLTTCVTNKGKSFIIDGKKLKSVNQWANKENARLQSIKDKQGIIQTTKRQQNIWTKRNNRVNDYLNKAAKYIIDYCIKNNIGNIIIGCNSDFQRNSNIGKSNNQTFVNIPYSQLISKIQYLCKRYNIVFKKQEESYTSKASFFDKDNIPVYKPNNKSSYIFSGKRISRGQYQAKNGYIFNADCNGALNIMAKSKLVDMSILQCRGYLDQPKRIRIA